ncbi:hypothetical protein ACFW6F_08415 [Streptomyces sp. NPDC058746]|uniref:hypothetical protein n=1 Tax=Streptomyces sp. NPDC058746 TaxID=3346622 RepID=UPI00367A75E1
MDGRGGPVAGPARLRRQACAVLVLCGALVLTACNGDDGAGDAGAAGTTPGTGTASPANPSATATATATTATTGGPVPSASAGPAKKPTPASTAAPTGKPKPPAPAPAPTCSRPPVADDEIAVYRWTPEGGSAALIVKHGNWGCAVTDGRTPFVTVGEETFIPIAEDAKITALSPILSTTVSKPITLHELTSWLESHPNRGLVFHYNANHRGIIDTLGQEEYTP